MEVRVFNLATRQELSYWTAPALAVVAAYAQEHGDFNTWDYFKYWDCLEYGPRVVLCGDWTTIHHD